MAQGILRDNCSQRLWRKEGKEGKGRKGQGRERKERGRKVRERKGRARKGREGAGREGTGRKGRGAKEAVFGISLCQDRGRGDVLCSAVIEISGYKQKQKTTMEYQWLDISGFTRGAS